MTRKEKKTLAIFNLILLCGSTPPMLAWVWLQTPITWTSLYVYFFFMVWAVCSGLLLGWSLDE